jgi:predicted transcriptional regulator
MGNVNNWIFVKSVDAQNVQIPNTFASNQSIPSAKGSSVQRGEEHKRSAPDGDMEMETSSSAAETSMLIIGDEVSFTRQKVMEFLSSHTVYELVPDSGKVIVLDTQLRIQTAFHALYEQGIPAAPLWDSVRRQICGMISASDFIDAINKIRLSSTNSTKAQMMQELEAHTIATWRVRKASQAPLKKLVWLSPEENLKNAALVCLESNCSLIPIIAMGGKDNEKDKNDMRLLHLASLSGILSFLSRHFKSSMVAFPLLARPLDSLPIGTWQVSRDKNGDKMQRISKLHTITPTTKLTDALNLLLEANVSALPIVNDRGTLIDVYARSDIIQLASDSAYYAISFEEATVSDALIFSHHATLKNSGGVLGQNPRVPMPKASPRVYVCTRQDSLETVLETLALPGVRRIIVIEPESKCVEGIVSLQDVVSFLVSH